MVIIRFNILVSYVLLFITVCIQVIGCYFVLLLLEYVLFILKLDYTFTFTVLLNLSAITTGKIWVLQIFI